jgi:hypothetical protein
LGASATLIFPCRTGIFAYLPRRHAAGRRKIEVKGDALAIEVETRGFLPASGFTYLIDDGILPKVSPHAQYADILIPVVVSVDRDEHPAEFPDRTRATRTGVVACFDSEAVFAWYRGMVRLKVFSYQLKRDRVSSAKAFTIDDGDLLGIDITAASVWSVLFGERLATKLANEYCTELLDWLVPATP